MGLINILCPVCMKQQQWFTGNSDQRCAKCRFHGKVATDDQPQKPVPEFSFGGGIDHVRKLPTKKGHLTEDELMSKIKPDVTDKASKDNKPDAPSWEALYKKEANLLFEMAKERDTLAKKLQDTDDMLIQAEKRVKELEEELNHTMAAASIHAKEHRLARAEIEALQRNECGCLEELEKAQERIKTLESMDQAALQIAEIEKLRERIEELEQKVYYYQAFEKADKLEIDMHLNTIEEFKGREQVLVVALEKIASLYGDSRNDQDCMIGFVEARGIARTALKAHKEGAE